MSQGKLAEYLVQLDEQLFELVDIVRGKMTKLLSISMGALITIDVHAKETIEQLVKDRVDKPTSFDWIKQLRYYWEGPNKKALDCRVKCI
jgi:dynein heavy chain